MLLNLYLPLLITHSKNIFSRISDSFESMGWVHNTKPKNIKSDLNRWVSIAQRWIGCCIKPLYSNDFSRTVWHIFWGPSVTLQMWQVSHGGIFKSSKKAYPTNTAKYFWVDLSTHICTYSPFFEKFDACNNGIAIREFFATWRVATENFFRIDLAINYHFSYNSYFLWVVVKVI